MWDETSWCSIYYNIAHVYHILHKSLSSKLHSCIHIHCTSGQLTKITEEQATAMNAELGINER